MHEKIPQKVIAHHKINYKMKTTIQTVSIHTHGASLFCTVTSQKPIR